MSRLLRLWGGCLLFLVLLSPVSAQGQDPAVLIVAPYTTLQEQSLVQALPWQPLAQMSSSTARFRRLALVSQYASNGENRSPGINCPSSSSS